MRRRPSTLLAGLAIVAGSLALAPAGSALAGQGGAGQPGAGQPGAGQGAVVSAVPRSGTPQILDGAVFTVAQVGGTMVVGGSFTSATDAGGGTRYRTPYLLAFDASTGALRHAFRPRLNGVVHSVLPGPVAGTVYVGGDFTYVDGRPATSLSLLDLSDGAPHAGFAMPEPDGGVQTLQRLGSRLFVGGGFTHVGRQAHGGIVTLDATSGRIDPYLDSTVTGHHNWTPASPPTQAKAPVAVTRLALSPDGRTLVGIGNFRRVDGTPRDQIAMWTLPGTGHASLRAWRTDTYAPACVARAFDTYIRDVSFSPDGSYFAVAATGGYFAGTGCDAEARFETAATGQAVQPTWVAYTGGDSLLSTVVTGEAVYVGGHQRWLDNGHGPNRAAAGAVPRPGVAALDPANGLPLAWNPGRNPRGAGTYALYATPNGLWMGSDTTYIGSDTGGGTRYRRSRIAFFPLAGGRPTASKALADLPGTVYVGRVARTFDGHQVGRARQAGTPLDPTAVRATMMVGSTVLYTAGGALHSRTLRKGAWGPPHLVDPYDDPVWSGVQTGSGQTYRGVEPDFYLQIARLTSMFYDGHGLMYYTTSDRSGLYSRAFSPDSGTIRSTEVAVPGVRLPLLTGAFLSGGSLFYVTASDGDLHRATFPGTSALGPQTVVSGPVSDGVDWRSRVLFLAPS